jgi:hypothetical protein
VKPNSWLVEWLHCSEHLMAEEAGTLVRCSTMSYGFRCCALCGCSVKAYHDQAVAAGIPALTTAGIYPGTSNVMAAHIVSISRGEYDENWNYKDTPTG